MAVLTVLNQRRLLLSLAAALLSLLATAVQAQTATAPEPASGSEPVPGSLGPVPLGARLTLSAPRTDWLIGERLVATLRLENRGNSAFRFAFAGSESPAPRGRYHRLKIIATDAEGRQAADPMPLDWGGGTSVVAELQPGQQQEWKLPLQNYCRLDRPGTYTLRIKHDFGWQESHGRSLPVAQMTLTLATPTPQQAEAVIAGLASTWTTGNQAPDYTDLTDPVYLSPLLLRARRGELAAIAGMGAIATPEATLALIDLSANVRKPVALAAARALNQRLPVLPRDGWGPAGTPDPRRVYLVEKAWQQEFALSVNVRAAVLLTAGDRGLLVEAAEMLERVGDREDIAQIIRALDRELAGVRDLYPPPPSAAEALLRAARALYQRGARPPSAPRSKSAGECAAFLCWLEVQDWARVAPAWQTRLLPMLSHRLPVIRALALAALPERFPSASLPAPARAAAEAGDGVLKVVRKKLPGLLEDKSLVVRISACEAAAKVQDWNLRGQLAKILSTSSHSWERRAAGNSLLALGGRYLYLTTWARRLDNPGLMYEALQALCGVFRCSGGDYDRSQESPALAGTLKQRWLRFLAAHRPEIEAGKTWDWTTQDASRELVPAHYKLVPASDSAREPAPETTSANETTPTPHYQQERR